MFNLNYTKMGVFSTNQNRQMYVATSKVNAVTAGASHAGEIAVKSNTAKTEMYFNYVGADGTVMRSDLIPLDKITYAKATGADALKMKFKSVRVHLATAAPVAGEDYVLRININQAFGKGDDTTYQKFGALHVPANMTAAQFWTAMKASLERNFSKELTKWFEFSLVSTAATTYVASTAYAVGTLLKNSNKYYVVNEAITTSDASFPTNKVTEVAEGLIITEAEQPWVPGKTPKENVHFTVVNCYVKDSSNVETEAFTIAKPTYTLEAHNGHIVVDQEIFYMGERGDQYRDTSGIYKMNVQYLASASTDYCAMDIHYSFVDSNEGVQKSEKDVYIVATATEMAKIITAVNNIKEGLVNTL